MKRKKKNRPDIQFKIYEVNNDKDSAWQVFAKYHYLNHNFNKAAHVYVCTVDDNIAGFCAIMAFPHPKIKNIWKEHCVVVLPDYQGIGIGSKMTDCIAQMYKDKGCKYVCVTSATAFIHARSKSPKWIVARKPGRIIQGKTYTIKSTSNSRITVSFKYKG